MLLERRSAFSGQVNTRELPITEAQLRRYESGGLIQNVFPDLTPDEREFIMTGITAEEWDELFGFDD